ncbi:MFS transporter [Flavisolibacter nicotianae]|uniref:MFS transporter n=1 Tax=Flavisolibacter nicotianae TaxID=2364882 RepID=UPI000EACF86F|nr:MFS transporter [Flavisolibacter nicotianae]
MAAPKGIWKVITASSVGTLIEWYDFYIFGSLSTIIAAKFFPAENPTAALLSTLATFAAGFIVRPFGALVFGRLGDLIGRKYTFLLTLVIMGLSTFLIGCIPAYETIGAWAPSLVLLLRLLQGLALGGEYGGAATYVAEHTTAHRRGFYTSWIQTTATLGLFLSLGVILSIRRLVGVDEFTNGQGWRYPFLLSIVLVLVSIFIRLRMNESPLFEKLKTEGKTSVNPLKESFGHKANFKMVLLALFGVTMGQGVIWYTGQFYAQTFLLSKCNLDYEQANTIILIALVIATPFFVLFGSLSDKWGRKNIMMAGILLGVLLYRPIFNEIYLTADVTHKDITETTSSQVTNAVKMQTITTVFKTFADDSRLKTTATKHVGEPVIKNEVTLSSRDKWKVVGLVALMVLFVTMVYGPVAAFLVELFPTKIRYTSMSLPYHIGNGVFGGLVPFLATLITTIKGTDHLSGLWYPIGVGALSFIIGSLYLSNKIHEDVTE